MQLARQKSSACSTMVATKMNLTRDGAFSIVALREIAFEQQTALNKVRERHDKFERILNKEHEGGWIGWSL